MKLPLYQVDAFTDRVFHGNPAAVCPLEEWLDDETLAGIAAENNLSETAFFVGEGERYHIRWFTPTAEVQLCGHATLASAFVITQILGKGGMGRGGLSFESLSGELRARVEEDGRIVLDLPVYPPEPVATDPALVEALGREPEAVLASNYIYAVYPDEAAVRALEPDFVKLAAVNEIGHDVGVSVTAPGDEVDFVSRFFAPSVGIPEDPVTGSAHCGLTPLWAKRLGRTRLKAWQLSRRGGELSCELQSDRVFVGGHAVRYLEGVIEL